MLKCGAFRAAGAEIHGILPTLLEAGAAGCPGGVLHGLKGVALQAQEPEEAETKGDQAATAKG